MFDDVFVFQQSDSQLCLVKCYPNQNCRFLKFTLPQEIKINSLKDPNDNIYPNRLIGYWNNYILFVTENKIYSFDVEEYLSKEDYKLEESENEIPLDKHRFYQTGISSAYYALALIQAQDQTTCLVLASKKTNKLTFFNVKNIENDNRNREKFSRGKIELTQMGNNRDDLKDEKQKEEQTDDQVVTIKQFVSVVSKDKQDQVFQAAMCLLSNGRVEFYYNFNRISKGKNQFQRGEDQKNFVKMEWIGTDLKNFFFYREPYDNHSNISAKEQQKRLYRCDLENGNRIGFLTAKKIASSKNDRLMMHAKIREHFKSFTASMNFQVFVVVAYRDRLIKIDLTNERENAILIQYQLDDEVLDMSSVKNPKDDNQRYLMVTTKRNQLYVIREDFQEYDFSKPPKEIFGSDQKIIQCFREFEHLKAVLYLTQSAVAGKNQVAKSTIHCGQNIFKNFDQFQVQSQFKLYACSTNGEALELDIEEFESITSKPDLALFIDKSEANQSGSQVWLMLDYENQEDEGKRTQIYQLLYQDQDNFSITVEKEKQEFLLNQKLEKGKLIGVICAWSKDYGKSKGFIARITSLNICVYSSAKNKFQFKFAFLNIGITKMLLIDETNLYCLRERNRQKFMIEKAGKVPIECTGIYPQKRVRGVVFIDMQRLIKDAQLDLYHLTKCVCGVNDQLELSDQDRICFTENFSSIQLLPLIHRNSLSFVGMLPQDNYLIWREKNGFFTALQENGEIHTWSMLTGSHLFEKPDANLAKDLEGFKVYKSCEKDDQYTRAYYNGRNSTIQLLIKDEPQYPQVLSRGWFQDDKKSKQSSSEIFTKEEGNQKVHIKDDIINLKYEFKVLELKMHQDFQYENNYDQFVDEETVRELFNFTFNISVRPKEKKGKNDEEKMNSKEKNAKIKPNDDEQQEFEIDGRLQLVLSQDTQRLMVIIENDFFCIFERDVDFQSNGQKINWRPDPNRQFVKFPSLLQDQMKANFLFDPTFTYFINCDYERECFVVVKTDGKHYKDIPKDQISPYSSKQIKTLDMIQLQAKKLFFSSKNAFEYISSEGLWTLLNIHDEKEEKGEMRVKCYSRMKNRSETFINDPHAILNPACIPDDQVFKKILRKSQWADIRLERAKYNEEQILKKLKRQRLPTQKNLKQDFQKTLLSSLYDIDYNNKVNGELMFQAESSFTILDWLIIDEVMNNKNVNIENVEHNQRIQLCMNIFPCRKTVLHYFVDNCFKKAEGENSVNNQDVVITLFQTCEKGIKTTAVGEVQANIPLEIPIFEDCYGQTPFDIALSIKKHQLSQLFQNKMKDPYDSQKNKNEQGIDDGTKTSEMMAGILFASTKDYKFLHSAHLISNAVIIAVEKGVPGMGEYIQGRLKTPTNLPSLNQRPNKAKMKGVFISLNDLDQRKYTAYGSASMKLFCGKEEIEERFFKSQKGATKLMDMLQLDIPHIFEPINKQGVQFIKALNVTKEVELFSLQSIQAVINYHFDSAYLKSYLWICIIIPYLAQLALFITWSNTTLKKDLQAERTETDYNLEYALAALCIWFMLIELRKIFVFDWYYFFNIRIPVFNWKYFFNIWNNMNFVPMILILLNIFLHETRQKEYWLDFMNKKYFWDVQAMAALTLWGKLLYILRSFDSTGYLIRSLVEVTQDMWVFLVVLLIVVIGFGDAFGSLNLTQEYEWRIKANEAGLDLEAKEGEEGGDFEKLKGLKDKYYDFIEERNNFAASIYYSLSNLKGEDNGNFSPYMTVFSVICYVLLNIVMMNLLIAIVSASFERVAQSSIQYSFKEKVGLISDIYDVIGLFHNKCKKKDAKLGYLIKGAKTEFLFIVKEDEKNKEAIPDEEEEETEMSIDERVENLAEEVMYIKVRTDEMLDKLDNRQ